MITTNSKVLILSYCVCLFFSCSSLKNNTPMEQNNEKYRKIAEEKYKNNISYTFNQNKTYVLCKKHVKPSSKMPQSSVLFFVYDMVNDQIIYEKSIDNGDVKWATDDQLQISIIPGNITGDEDLNKFKYLYDLKEQKIIKDELPIKSE